MDDLQQQYRTYEDAVENEISNASEAIEVGIRHPTDPRIKPFYRDYRAELGHALRGMFGDGPPDPDDVAQDAFLQLLKRTDLASIQNLKAFVWRSARNILLNGRNRQSVRSRYDYEIEHLAFAMKGYESTPSAVIEAKEQLDIINEALKGMPKVRSRAFILHRFEGLSITDAGRKLGISRPAASKHIARASADLAAALAAGDEG